MAIRLKEIIDGMEMAGPETRVFYDPEKEEIVTYFDFMDEEEKDSFEEEYEEKQLIALPDQYDIHEYRMMEGFARDLDDIKTANSLLIALQGKGAFRRFKDMAINLGVVEEWYRYRDFCYRNKAIEWCEFHNINYKED